MDKCEETDDVETPSAFYVYAITFDQDTFGVYATQNEAEESLAKQIVDGGPAWDACEVTRWLVQGKPEQDTLWQKDYDALSKSRDDLAEQIDRLTAAVEGLLDWEERFRAGDPNLDPEERHAIRDFAKVTLGRKHDSSTTS